MKKKHKLVNDGTGFMICTKCGWNTGGLLERPDYTPDCVEEHENK